VILDQKRARVFGVLYLITFATSIPAALLYRRRYRELAIDGLHSLQAIATIPEALWELFLGVYCTVWGFRASSPILARKPEQRAATAPAPAVG
jgi:hypothetical protein